MNIETVVEIDKPPSEVYEFLMDEENLILWLRNFVRKEQVSGESRAVGSVAKYYYNENGKINAYTEKVIANEEHKLFEDILYNDHLEFRFKNELESIDQNNTRLKVSAKITPKNIISRIILFFSKKKIHKRHQENLARLKNAIEMLTDIE